MALKLPLQHFIMQIFSEVKFAHAITKFYISLQIWMLNSALVSRIDYNLA